MSNTKGLLKTLKEEIDQLELEKAVLLLITKNTF